MDLFMPTSSVVSDVNSLVVYGFVFGLGISLAFWLGGYVTRSLLSYLGGGY